MNAQQASLKNASPAAPAGYAARLDIEYSEKLDRLTTFFRLFMIIPIAIILGLLARIRANCHQHGISGSSPTCRSAHARCGRRHSKRYRNRHRFDDPLPAALSALVV